MFHVRYNYFDSLEVARMIVLVVLDICIQNMQVIEDVISWLLVRLDKAEPPL
jgi:hypothetical protein